MQQREDQADFLEAKAAYASHIASGEQAVSWEDMKQHVPSIIS